MKSSRETLQGACATARLANGFLQIATCGGAFSGVIPTREAERDGGAIPALLSRMRTNQESAYAVVTALGAIEKTERSGLSHVAAMRLAEELRRDGKVAIVMHVVGGKSYEVDRYPAR